MRLQQVMEMHWHRNLALADLAFLCGMSLSTFKRAFEGHYGQSPGRWLQERRLRHASHLLVAERRREIKRRRAAEKAAREAVRHDEGAASR